MKVFIPKNNDRLEIDMDSFAKGTNLPLLDYITFKSASQYIDPNNESDLESLRIGFCDIETTGLSEVINTITQFSGFVREKHKELNREIEIEYDLFINPGTHIPVRIYRITGINDDSMRKHSGMTFEKFVEMISFFNHSDVIMTWNGINFDKPRVVQTIEKCIETYSEEIKRLIEESPELVSSMSFFRPPSVFENEWLDLFKLVSNPIYSDIVAGAKNNKQTTISAHLGLPDYEAHNSLEDVKALSRIYFHLADNGVIPSCYGKFLLAQSGVAV